MPNSERMEVLISNANLVVSNQTQMHNIQLSLVEFGNSYAINLTQPNASECDRDLVWFERPLSNQMSRDQTEGTCPNTEPVRYLEVDFN